MALFLHPIGRAIKQEMDKADAGQWQRSKIAVGCCTWGAVHPSRLQRWWITVKPEERRQRAKRECLRDEWTVSRTLARSLNPFRGGSDPRNPETTGKLQILQKLSIPSVVEGNSNLSIQDSLVYVGMDSHMPRLENDKSVK